MTSFGMLKYHVRLQLSSGLLYFMHIGRTLIIMEGYYMVVTIIYSGAIVWEAPSSGFYNYNVDAIFLRMLVKPALACVLEMIMMFSFKLEQIGSPFVFQFLRGRSWVSYKLPNGFSS